MAPTCTTGELVNSRKLKLFTQHWKPESQPIAALIWLHGLGEYSNRYKDVFQKLASAGIAVHAYDHIGHGLSMDIPGRGRANINEWNDLPADAELFVKHVEADHYKGGMPPRFIAGQSLGGLIATYTVLRNPSWFAEGGLILLSAAIDVEWTLILRIQQPFGVLLSALVPNAPLVPAVAPEAMSSAPERVAEYIADPMIAHGNMKCRIANESLGAFSSLKKRYGEIVCPLLVMHGTADKCTSYGASKRLFDAAGSKDKTHVPWEGYYHETLFEPRGGVVEKLTSWIVERASANKVGASAKL